MNKLTVLLFSVLVLVVGNEIWKKVSFNLEPAQIGFLAVSAIASATVGFLIWNRCQIRP